MDAAGWVTIGQIIGCKGCGAIETYEMSPFTRVCLTKLIKPAVRNREEFPEFFDTPLKIYGHLRIMGRGRKFQSVGGAYHFLKDQIEEHPQDGDLQRRMGNFLRNGGKQDLALPYYLEAIKLNPSDAESYYCISDMLIDEQRYEEAIPYFEQLVSLCRESKMDDNLRRGIFPLCSIRLTLSRRKLATK